MQQRTILSPFSFSGKGLHTGLHLNISFHPAPENYGYKVQRIDLPEKPIIDALAENVVDVSRGTVIAKGEARVSTIEHAVSALYAMGVDNCLMQVDGPEFPILDGSARRYVEEIERVGLQEQTAERVYFRVRKKISVQDEEKGSQITILPDDDFSVTTLISFDSQLISSQYATLDHMSDYPKEISAARTFVFVRDLEPLLAAGLIKGGDLTNAIVVYERKISQESLDHIADTMGVPHIDATQLGYLTPLIWPNEPARHKLLDIIGDLALIGKPLKGRVIATRPGHAINNKFARLMLREVRAREAQAPHYRPDATPLMDVNRIRQLLPHRYPMQLVDRVVEIGEKYIVALKNVTSNESFFQGHFPNEPVMPGVLQIEALAQAGGLLVLNGLDEPERWSTYFLRIDNVKFRRKVVPGDTLLFRVELLAPIRHGISSMHGVAYVGGTPVMEASFTAQITKNR